MASRSKEDVPFDIKKRTFLFAVRIVQLVGKLPRTVAGIEIGRQLLRSGTSVGSNVEEADGAISRKDFVNHTRIARKEARESRYWLTRIEAADLLREPDVPALANEAEELSRILSKIAITASLGKSLTTKSQ